VEISATIYFIRIACLFPREYFECETGKHYNYFRDYDPAIGRYVESDPIGLRGGINTYTYVSNDPLRGSDFFGLANSGMHPRPNPKPACYKQVQETAFREVEAVGGWSSVNDNTGFNAVLHCYGTCRLQNECGTMHRMVVTYGHETWDRLPSEAVGMPAFIRNPGGTWNDLHNNGEGVDCSNEKCGGKGSCMSCCMRKLSNNQLRFGVGGGR
jgi:RHS repeat-associated protein